MNVGIGSEAAQFLFLGIHKSDFRYSADLQWFESNYTMITELEQCTYSILCILALLLCNDLFSIVEKNSVSVKDLFIYL
jgi:hypothetical protein